MKLTLHAENGDSISEFDLGVKGRISIAFRFLVGKDIEIGGFDKVVISHQILESKRARK